MSYANAPENFGKSCIDLVNTEGISYRVAAVGTPGIGKTTSSTPILLRMLLEANYTVVYKICSTEKNRWYYEFIPALDADGNRVGCHVNVYPENLAYDDIPSLYLEETYYIVDSGNYKDNCVPDTSLPAKLILVTSPDSRLWGESDFRKYRQGVEELFAYYPTWTLQELKDASSVLMAEIPENEKGSFDLNERFREMGGVPRHIFCSGKSYGFTQEAQQQALNFLDGDQAKKLALNEVREVDNMESKQQKVPSSDTW